MTIVWLRGVATYSIALNAGQSNDQHLVYLGIVRRPDATHGIRNVLLDGGVPVSGTRRRERALPVPGRQAQRFRGTRYLLT